MAQRVGSARGDDYAVRLARDARPREGGNSGRRALSPIGALSVLGRRVIRRRRRDLGPSLAQSDGLAHTIKELPLAVVMLPAPAVIELEKMCAPTVGKGAPFLGDLVECMPW
jgi:hypothetical protein